MISRILLILGLQAQVFFGDKNNLFLKQNTSYFCDLILEEIKLPETLNLSFLFQIEKIGGKSLQNCRNENLTVLFF